MAEFIEFEEFNGDKVLVNIEHIIKVRSAKEGTYIYFDSAIEHQGSSSLALLHITENFSSVKRKLQQ